MDIIEIAKDHCFSRQVVDGETVLITFRSQQLQQFAQRIEQPLQHRINELIFDVAHQQRQIAELEKDCDILATNYDAARRASRFAADVADQALADLKAAEQQIEQLREALEKIADLDGNWGPFPETNKHWCAMAVVTARETLKEMEQTK